MAKLIKIEVKMKVLGKMQKTVAFFVQKMAKKSFEKALWVYSWLGVVHICVMCIWESFIDGLNNLLSTLGN